MSDWEVVPQETGSDWQIEDSINNQKQNRRFGEKIPAWLLGLGQFGEDFIKGNAEGLAEPEVDIPEQWKHPRTRKENQPERYSPSLNLEQYVAPDKMTQFNIGRYGPAVASAAIGGGKAIKSLVKPYTNKAIGQAIVKGGKEAKKVAKKEYNQFFDQMEAQNPSPIKISVPQKDLNRVLSATTDKKYYKNLQNAIDNPTQRNVHFAQSDLGKFIRMMERKTARGVQLTGPENKALKTAIEAQDKLKNDLYRSLMETGGMDAPFKYSELSEKYRQNVIPYLQSNAIRRASKKPGHEEYISPARLPHELSLKGGDPFKAHILGDPITGKPINPYLHGKYPELKWNRRFAGALGKGLLGAAGVGGAGALISHELKGG